MTVEQLKSAPPISPQTSRALPYLIELWEQFQRWRFKPDERDAAEIEMLAIDNRMERL